jgi:peptidyl-prolyl cis-trans isomerase-like 3
MVQTGDPSGTGKGGESIYGGKMEDEIRATLKVYISACERSAIDD